jgi:hypothetical protein
MLRSEFFSKKAIQIINIISQQLKQQASTS